MEELATITFSLASTKAVPECVIYPSEIDLTLTSDNGKYQVKTGETITLPTGEYNVVGKYTPQKNFVIGTSVYTSKIPAVSVSESIEVRSGTNTYQLTGILNSFILSVDSGEVSSWTIEGKTFDFLSDGSEWYTFVGGDLSQRNLKTTIVPRQDGYLTTTFSLTTNPAREGELVEFGKFYHLHPEEHPTQDSGIIVNFPPFSAGD